MTSGESELIHMIRDADDPAWALMTAAKIICDFLKQRESSEEQAAADLQEPA